MPWKPGDLKNLWSEWTGAAWPAAPSHVAESRLPQPPPTNVLPARDFRARSIAWFRENFFSWNKSAMFVSDVDPAFNEKFKEQVASLGEKFDPDKLQALARAEKANLNDAFFRVYYEGGLLKEVAREEANRFYWNDRYTPIPLNRPNATAVGSGFNGKSKEWVCARIKEGGIRPAVFNARARAIILFLGLEEEWRKKGTDAADFLRAKFGKAN